MRERKPAKGSQNDTRTRIINAAIELFNDYGFDETTIPMICEKAKVSKTTLHYYFPRKQDIFLDMQNNFEELYADNFYRIVEQETFSKQIWEIFHIMCEGDIFYGAGVSQQYFVGRLKEHSQRDFIKNIYHKKNVDCCHSLCAECRTDSESDRSGDIGRGTVVCNARRHCDLGD